jgi:tetratricopeptide (TPR) repeat protein
MMLRPYFASPLFLTVMRGILQMHRLDVDGQLESAEADALRDAMDAPWGGLSDLERKRIEGLSLDLHATGESTGDQTPLESNSQAQVKLFEAYEARERGEWDRALELLRRWGKYAPAALVAYLRGTIWNNAGVPEAAAVFFEAASRLEPENGNYQAALLHVLKRADPADAAIRAQQVLLDPELRIPPVVIYAADILFGIAKKALDPDAALTYRRLIPILERTLIRIEGTEYEKGPTPQMALVLLASCYEHLGNTQRAYEFYSRAIQLDPANDLLLLARGQLVYGTNLQSPADFEQAVQLGSELVWPYFFLAHYYLANTRFEDARSISERGLHRQASMQIKSILYEFLAISQAGLNYPEDVIRRSFENALRSDPSNDSARRNLDRFETALSSREPRPRNWEERSESSLRMFSQHTVWDEELLLSQGEHALV